MDSILSAVVMFSNKTKWKQWGMDRLREQGAALLFQGPPGTGKTITARWLARKLRLQLQEVDYSLIGSGEPGELQKNVNSEFDKAEVQDANGNYSMVFIDECDTCLVDRRKLGSTALWMLEPINALLSRIGTYPGLVVLCTNSVPEFLDFALERRLIGTFNFGVPTKLTRVKLWQAKFPKRAPTGRADWDRLARYELTGAQIETLLINWVSDAIRRDFDPNLDDLYRMLEPDAYTIKEESELEESGFSEYYARKDEADKPIPDLLK